MSDLNIEIKKAVINQAYNNREISKDQYERIIGVLNAKTEEQRLQKKLKEYEDEEFLRRYKSLSLT